MLPFGVKLAWFVLSLTGLIGCWAVLLPLAWAIQSYWGPMVYAVGISALEGVFCLGLIWRMDPAEMPKAFCIAQVLVTGCATFAIVGLLAAITTWTSAYVAKPKQWGSSDDSLIFPWQLYYLLPMLLFPLLASAVHVTVVVYFDTFQPFDGLSCVARPAWIRFLGFAGTPFVITVPSLWLTTLSAIRVLRTHRHIRRARRSANIEELDNFTVLPQRRKSRPSSKTRPTPPTPYAITAPSPSPSSIVRMSREERRQPISPVLLQEKITGFHLPFVPPFPVNTSASSRFITASPGNHSQLSEDSFDTVSSVAFAEIEVKIKAPRLPRILQVSPGTEADADEDADLTTPLRTLAPSDGNTPSGTTRSTDFGRSVHNSDHISLTQIALGLQNDLVFSEDTDYDLHGTTGDRDDDEILTISEISKSPTAPTSQYRNPTELPSLVRSLLIFQFAIIAIHLLSTITPFIDLISDARSGAPPAAVGTQHVALLLAGWAPIAVFAPLSAVRRQLTRR